MTAMGRNRALTTSLFRPLPKAGMLFVWTPEAGNVVLGHRSGILVVNPWLLASIMSTGDAIFLEWRTRPGLTA